jgi:hypothetical protein
VERETGIEPATSSLGSWRSTAELLPLGLKMCYLALVSSIYGLSRLSFQSREFTHFPMVGLENGQCHGQ